ncbi:hypothetical protein DP113_12755 [Brasilonema octagenarum UFV-E1]|uniref:Uncharacterized protein n=2 Tax=Brasilonema TaxID=383614 RepID=A0A856MI53_9CYAN|nr:hypothetical protein [Brasilonema octagenarum UFV-OR1]QDL08656.1 hypothetical protein DP114_12820 [Brasilonema sennae CENA114]QDL15011.1 hypothetical protein DP113_12755 [Brasilonema octagenarum UFV-E1]
MIVLVVQTDIVILNPEPQRAQLAFVKYSIEAVKSLVSLVKSRKKRQITKDVHNHEFYNSKKTAIKT